MSEAKAQQVRLVRLEQLDRLGQSGQLEQQEQLVRSELLDQQVLKVQWETLVHLE